MKRFYLICLILVLLLTILPTTAFAENGRMEFPKYYTTECPEKGSLTTLKNDKTRDIRVWTPYGYDDNVRHEVILLLHGRGGSINDWLDNEYVAFSKADGLLTGANLLDWMIYENKCKHIIVATIESENKVNMRDFEDEIVDILSVIIDNYHTFAEDSSHEGIIAARDHFLIGGLSNGAVSTCYFMRDKFEYAANYAILSGGAKEWDIKERLLKNGEKINNLFIAYGKSDRYDWIKNDCYGCYSALKNLSQNVVYKQYPDGHDFKTWFSSLYDICTTFYPWEDNSIHAKLDALIAKTISMA